eukprot:GILJ01004430.1.p1 GENE.GILJ01004430.1~~GILJ01004430.1.p1  ORF type:complete len:574 (-),score=97.44 GILJ01004430.1:391-2049(-)
MAVFKRIAGGYAELWKAIIRPPREEYNVADLGPEEFMIEGRHYCRTDITLKNPRGLNIQGSHFQPVASERAAKHLPCVIYMHGNCSCRLEALHILRVLLPASITVFAFDFTGSGLSEGTYVSLGWYERDDLQAVVDYLRGTDAVSCIGLWGRSMGAVTALLHGDRDPSIAAMVLDSPFSSLRVLAEELAASYVKVPKLVLNGALSMIRKTVNNKAKFDINKLNPLEHVDRCFIPALFASADKDDFIRPHHAKDLFERYAGDKNYVSVEGDHNSMRPQFFLDSVSIFFYNTLMCDTIPPPPAPNHRRNVFELNAYGTRSLSPQSPIANLRRGEFERDMDMSLDASQEDDSVESSETEEDENNHHSASIAAAAGGSTQHAEGMAERRIQRRTREGLEEEVLDPTSVHASADSQRSATTSTVRSRMNNSLVNNQLWQDEEEMIRQAILLSLQEAQQQQDIGTLEENSHNEPSQQQTQHESDAQSSNQSFSFNMSADRNLQADRFANIGSTSGSDVDLAAFSANVAAYSGDSLHASIMPAADGNPPPSSSSDTPRR